MIGPTRDIGPCEVWYNGSKIGEYYESVDVAFSENEAYVYEASHGKTPVDSVRTGQNPMEVTVPMTRMSLAALATIIPGGSVSSGTTDALRVFNNKVGTAEYGNSAELILKPVVDSAVSASDYWLHVPHASPKPELAFSYHDNDGQRVYGVVFRSFPDATTKETWHIGPTS